MQGEGETSPIKGSAREQHQGKKRKSRDGFSPVVLTSPDGEGVSLFKRTKIIPKPGPEWIRGEMPEKNKQESLLQADVEGAAERRGRAEGVLFAAN